MSETIINRKKIHKRRDERDNGQDKVGVWDRVTLVKNEASKDSIDFVFRCFSENLNHARHVEIERLTFNSIYFALAVGVMAFMPKANNGHLISGIMCLCVFFAGIISITLTRRWNNAYDRHYTYAKRCYKMLWECYFSSYETVKGLNDDCINDKEFLNEIHNFSLYCFGIRNPKYGITFREHKFSTKSLYLLFCYSIQIAILGAALYSFWPWIKNSIFWPWIKNYIKLIIVGTVILIIICFALYIKNNYIRD